MADGERIINISSIARREFTLSLKVFFDAGLEKLPSKGPRGNPIATPSVYLAQGSIELEQLSFGSYVEKVNKIRFGAVQAVCCINPIVCENSVREKLYRFI